MRTIVLAVAVALGACASNDAPPPQYRAPVAKDLAEQPRVASTPDWKARNKEQSARRAQRKGPLHCYACRQYPDLTRASLEAVAALASSSTTITMNDNQLIDSSLQAARSMLKDPSSAQFEQIRLVDYQDGKVVCGEVNAKNSYGGYVGFRPFVAGPIGATFYEQSEHPDIERAANAGLLDACYPQIKTAE
jgi:hypothetical protein